MSEKRVPKSDAPSEATPNEVREQRLASVGELMSGLAHEARNILSGILSFAQVGQHRTEDPEKMAAILGAIEDEALRCIDLFSAAMGHAEVGREEQPESCIQDALRSSTRLIQHQLGMRKIRLSAVGASDSVRVCMEAGALRQVVLNLLINAMHAAPDGGEIRVSIRNGEDGVCLAVEDSGGGIPPHLREPVFERRYTTKESGTGFGLAISRDLVHASRGTLHVDDSDLGGARFLLTLQAAKENSDG